MKFPTGLDLIKAERRRQITKKKWTAKNDDGHVDCCLAVAARCYQRCAFFQINCGKVPNEFSAAFDFAPKNWPWEPHWFKLGRTAIRTLVKAGALFRAEVDRLMRVKKRGGQILETDLAEAGLGVTNCARKIDELLA